MLLWNSQISGNCYKVRLLLAHLGLPYERRELSVVDRSDRSVGVDGRDAAEEVGELLLGREGVGQLGGAPEPRHIPLAG